MFNRMSAGKEEGTSYRTEVSYLEIYNERVKDLIKKNSTHNLKVIYSVAMQLVVNECLWLVFFVLIRAFVN